MKRALIIHGWGGYPEEGWFPWLKRTLEERGFMVSIPQMPNPDRPTIEPWVKELVKTVGETTANLTLIGHSIGCQTIVRYLETLSVGQTVDTVILVAPFLELLTLGDDEDQAIAEPWLTTPINYAEVKSHASKIVALFSDNDPFVPLANAKIIEERLGAKTHIYQNKGHFSGENGIFEIPEILEFIP